MSTNSNFFNAPQDAAGGTRKMWSGANSHTNIFGPSEPNDYCTPSKNAPQVPASKNVVASGEKGEPKEIRAAGESVKNGNAPKNGENNDGSANERVRVPPGGFSTRLW